MVPENITETTAVERVPLTSNEKQTMLKLIDRAQGGDKKAMAELGPLLDRADFWGHLNDLGRKVQEMWLDTMTRTNRLAHEAYGRRANDMRQELLVPGDSPLERLLADRIVLTWLQVCHADCLSAVLLQKDSYTYKSAEHAEQRQDRANARHLKAVKALASVRRLLAPAVQVNIGKNQIITQGGPTVGGQEAGEDAPRD